MAAMAPAVPATMKLGPLQRKPSRQISHADCRIDIAIAPATRPVLRKKYVEIAPTSGLDSVANESDPARPPNAMYTSPVAAIVNASAAMLNTVRYQGSDRLAFTVHCVNVPAIATSTAGRGPRSRSAIKSAAYDTDSVARLARGIGSVTFHAEVTQEQHSRAANRVGSGHVRGNDAAAVHAPATITTLT